MPPSWPMNSRQEEAEYWRARRDELLGQMADDERELFAKLDRLYASESAKLERDIAAYYQRYGEGNVIEYRTLLTSLSEADRRLLMERMEDFARKYPQYAHLMPIRESIYKLNELEGIQAAIRLQQLEIGAIEQGMFEEHFERQAQRGANFAAEQMGFGENFYTLNAQVVTETVGAAWAAGQAFSERIWENREKLASYLNDDFAKLVARGVAYDKLSHELADRFGHVSARDAKRLVYTEGTFLFNEAQAQVHEQDFEFYALSCIHDGKTCKVCRELESAQQANPVRFSERSPGVNFPPLHPWCRCSYTVEVDDWDAWIDSYVAERGGDAVTPSAYVNAIPPEITDRYDLSNYSDVVFGTRIGGECAIDIESLKQVMGAVERAKAEVPQLYDSIKTVMLRTEAAFVNQSEWNAARLAAVHRSHTDTILLGDRFATMSRGELESFISALHEGRYFATGTIEGVILHECGHIACFTVASNHPEIWLNGSEVARDAVTKAFSTWKKRNVRLFELGIFDESMEVDKFMALISEDAAIDCEEAVAEAFASAIIEGVGDGTSATAVLYEEITGLLRL